MQIGIIFKGKWVIFSFKLALSMCCVVSQNCKSIKNHGTEHTLVILLLLTKNAVQDGEWHLDDSDETLSRLRKCSGRYHVPKSDGAQGDEAEVKAGSKAPVFPIPENHGPEEEERENDDQVDHNGHVDHVGWHVRFLSNFIVLDWPTFAINARRKFSITTTDTTPTATATAARKVYNSS